MAEWLYEAGIGEARAALVSRGTIWKVRIEPDDAGLRIDTVARGHLIEILNPRTSGLVKLESGEDVLCEQLSPGITKGAALTVRITREGIPERGRPKLPKGVPTDQSPGPGPDLLQRLRAGDLPVRLLRAHEPDLLEQAGWSEVLEEAATGEIAFPGGALRMSVTPAMTLFDVDGQPPSGPLAVNAATAVARVIERFGIGGSIGIDFPTLASKAERNAVAEAIDAALPQPFERTALNGFGFLQIVRRRSRASLPELLAADPVGAATRAELRRLERLPPPPPATHMVSEAVRRRLAARADWTDELARRMGGAVRFAGPLETP